MLVFDQAVSFQITQKLALWSVVQDILSYGDKFLPVVPFPDGVFDFAEAFHERFIIRSLGHLQYVAKLLDLQTIRMQVCSAQARRCCQFSGKPKRRRCNF